MDNAFNQSYFTKDLKGPQRATERAFVDLWAFSVDLCEIRIKMSYAEWTIRSWAIVDSPNHFPWKSRFLYVKM